MLPCQLFFFVNYEQTAALVARLYHGWRHWPQLSMPWRGWYLTTRWKAGGLPTLSSYWNNPEVIEDYKNAVSKSYGWSRRAYATTSDPIRRTPGSAGEPPTMKRWAHACPIDPSQRLARHDYNHLAPFVRSTEPVQ